MAELATADVRDVWRSFLIDRTFAQNYRVGYMEDGPAMENPVLEKLLPSLLHVKAVAILDHAFQAWIQAMGLTMPFPPYRNDLNGRINYLADNGRIPDRAPLHTIRQTRNDLAHDPVDAVSWDELNRDAQAINAVLHHLGLVGAMPDWEVVAERSRAKPGEIPNAISTFDYRIGIQDKATAAIVAEITWQQHLMKNGA